MLVRKEVLASAVVAPGVGESVGRSAPLLAPRVENSKMKFISQVTPQQALGQQCPLHDVFDIILIPVVLHMVVTEVSRIGNL